MKNEDDRPKSALNTLIHEAITSQQKLETTYEADSVSIPAFSATSDPTMLLHPRATLEILSVNAGTAKAKILLNIVWSLLVLLL
jgi:hypothetical protein